MRLLLSGLDTVECAYYLRPGGECKIDFDALREQKETIRQSKQTEAGLLELGGMEYMLSPNGTRSGYPFLISNQDCAIQFGEFNDPSFFVAYRSFALWHKGAKFLHESSSPPSMRPFERSWMRSSRNSKASHYGPAPESSAPSGRVHTAFVRTGRLNSLCTKARIHWWAGSLSVLPCHTMRTS